MGRSVLRPYTCRAVFLVKRIHVADCFRCGVSVDLYPDRGAAAAGVDAGYAESECDLLGWREWGDVFCAHGWRARSRCWNREDSSGDLHFCGEPYEFGGCACGGWCDSTADCDFVEEVIVCVSHRWVGIFIGWIHSGESERARFGGREFG